MIFFVVVADFCLFLQTDVFQVPAKDDHDQNLGLS